MDDDRINEMIKLEPERLRAMLENMSTDELREIAINLARRLENG